MCVCVCVCDDFLFIFSIFHFENADICVVARVSKHLLYQNLILLQFS
jgi:hypothetical protein